MSRRTLSTRHRLVAISPPRYATRSEWVEDLAVIAMDVVCTDARCRAAAALAPVALWAARTRNASALRRVVLEVVRHAPEWDALWELGLRARAVLAAEPSEDPAPAPHPPSDTDKSGSASDRNNAKALAPLASAAEGTGD